MTSHVAETYRIDYTHTIKTSKTEPNLFSVDIVKNFIAMSQAESNGTLVLYSVLVQVGRFLVFGPEKVNKLAL